MCSVLFFWLNDKVLNTSIKVREKGSTMVSSKKKKVIQICNLIQRPFSQTPDV